MAYTNAIFYVDDGLVSGTAGSDSVRSTLSGVVFSNPSADVVLGTKTSHGLVTGAVVTVSNCGAAYANDVWKVTRVDDDTFTVDGASWASWNDADVTGDVVPFGGSSWADAWQTVNSGATAARIAPGDTIRIAKSPDPVSVGNALWTDGPLASTTAIVSSTNATPIVVTATAHGLINGDFVHITGHSTNTNANGYWIVANKTADTYELAGSVGNGVGGATGTCRKMNNRVVYLDTAQTQLIDDGEAAWTAATGSIATLSGTPTAGGTGYTAGDVLTITTGGVLGTATVSTVDGSGAVTAVTLTTGGTGYTTGTGKATSGGTGTGCTLNISTVANGASGSAGPSSAQVQEHYITVTPPNAAAGSLCAYKTISSVDLSAYSQLTLWFGANAGVAVVAGNFKVCLCSDTVGRVIVDTFRIPTLYSTGLATNALTLSRVGGGTCGASIQSIAVYIDTTPLISAQRLDNINVTTATGLSLNSVISKNSSANGGAEAWWPLGGILGRMVVLGQHPVSGVTDSSRRGYAGTTENVATYHRRCIGIYGNGANNAAFEANDSGSLAGGRITYSGGWNPGGTQNGHTFYDGRVASAGSGFYAGSKSFIACERLSFARYQNAVNLNPAQDCLLSFGDLCGCNGNVLNLAALSARNDVTVRNICANQGTTGQICFSGMNNVVRLLGLVHSNVNTTSAISFNTANNRLIGTSANCRNNSGLGVNFGTPGHVEGVAFSSNVSGSVGATSACSFATMRDCTLGDATQFVPGASSALGGNNRVYSQNDALGGYDKHYFEGGTINSEATDRAGGTGAMWRLNVTSTRTSNYPLELPVAQIACAANKLVTVKAWLKKSHATNVAGTLVCKGGQISGVAADVSATKASDTSYEQLTITFTPSIAGVVEIVVQAWYVAGSGSVVVEDLIITQAA